VLQDVAISQTQMSMPETNAAPSHLRELFDARELLWTWARREFRVRYSQSIMGAAWALVQPLALMLVFTFISVVMKVSTGNNLVPYPVFSYVGTLSWTLFANSLTFAIPSLVNNMNLVTKIYFPREILPMATILVGLLDFVIAAGVFIPLLIIFHISLTWTIVFVPLILVMQLVFTLGLSLFASAVNVFFRDVRFVVPLALQVWMYLSPVLYPVEQVPAWLRQIYFLNPMAVFVDSYRRAVLFGQTPDWPYFALASVVSLLGLILAYRYFKRAERTFADLI